MAADPVPAPRATLERVWWAYLACVAAVAAATPGGGAVGHEPERFLRVHAAVAVGVAVCHALAARRCHDAARLPRAALALVGLPVVFSALCWLLPAVHPEPYEYLWLELDRAVFGQDLARLADGLPRWAVELLQVDYAAFYAFCIVAVVLAGRASGRAAFDRATLAMVTGFLLSYLGYLLVPTLSPQLTLAHETDVQGLWLTPGLRESIDAAETNRWDCFPSGHTMMTLVALIVVRRWARRWFWWLLAPGILLVLSTMLLRYHWAADVVAGALCAWPAVRCCDWLADRDRWPRPEAGPGKDVTIR